MKCAYLFNDTPKYKRQHLRISNIEGYIDKPPKVIPPKERTVGECHNRSTAIRPWRRRTLHPCNSTSSKPNHPPCNTEGFMDSGNGIRDVSSEKMGPLFRSAAPSVEKPLLRITPQQPKAFHGQKTKILCHAADDSRHVTFEPRTVAATFLEPAAIDALFFFKRRE
mmetsp:Transcript_3050/g.6251  ORF Transcript_3050/g.6251 Transcript_3050/m.6251 type:complete len:166 (-) Transcript_3050:1019-1516(-)